MRPPVCVITGAGPGNGLALARRFAGAGYRIALLSRNADKLHALAEQLVDAHAYPCDVGKPSQVAETFRTIKADLGAVDTLLYNAGSMVFGDAETIDPADFEAAWRVNTLGLLHCARAVAPDMRSAGAGQIVITGATASLKGGARFAGFASAKAAQHSLAQSLARQLGPDGIHVAIAIIDGVIDSLRARQMMSQTSDDGFMQPEAIAESIYQITQQPRSAWTFQLDLRPFIETW